MMDAGRELDELIWRRVFGGAADLTPDVLGGWPPYSTDIAAAWQIVEQMRQQGWAFGFSGWEEPAERPDPWHASFWRSRGPTRESNATAATAPLAICLAALAVLGVPAGTAPQPPSVV